MKFNYHTKVFCASWRDAIASNSSNGRPTKQYYYSEQNRCDLGRASPWGRKCDTLLRVPRFGEFRNTGKPRLAQGILLLSMVQCWSIFVKSSLIALRGPGAGVSGAEG